MNNAEEKNTSHMIFYGEKDIDYTKSSNYAFLNWNFDNSLGGKNNVSQLIQDNFVMGNAYMGNAVLSLYSILCSGNYSLRQHNISLHFGKQLVLRIIKLPCNL